MNNFVREDIRNIAIIAHVDHGKTTLVDGLLRQSGTFRSNENVAERVMDSNDLERERGITILAKNTAINYKSIKINVVDTPGHADFGGEVERVLKMVDSVLLIVDASEGPMPQTRFVLKKALALALKPIVVINKIDRPDSRIPEVIDEIIDLFIDLGADDDQLDFPIIYASAKAGFAKYNMDDEGKDLTPLFETIINKVEPPSGSLDGPLQFLITTIEYDEYIGRVAVGKIFRGSIRYGQSAVLCKRDGSVQNVKIGRFYGFIGLKRIEINEASIGDIIAIPGIDDINIGETLCDVQNPDPLPLIEVEEPTISMTFMVNNSPFAGREGDYVTSRHLRARLMKELETNVALRVLETDSPDAFEVYGRGELHLSILIETMRREGYEFQVSKPTVILKEINGEICEPIENLFVEVPQDYLGVVMEKLGARRAEMLNMHTTNDSYLKVEFKIPTRGLIGYRSQFLTDTKGNGIMHHLFMGFEPHKGEVPERNRGALVAFEAGETTTYGLYNVQDRGELFVGAGIEVYEGMIVGESAKSDDLDVNVCKKKHVSNMRASGSDEALKLSPHIEMSLEECLEFIAGDELVEITPKSIRLRKKVLDGSLRAKMRKG
ncbi:translational GTPase TypA [Lutispora saccharofermentans]|uniref:Large ribosomal subunit assembly factor BipA n=1 Tax=Lutispora saccharofermentans TaxID=3024236 RepID=A0ABT1NEX5_9FIRM|nr:translational GTPase TypA [Lutispora saccharofermentans]MCQ1529790.1 translational GTPase TypA [Lutispora saccharofermentans]